MAEAFGLAAGVLQVASFGAGLGGSLWKCARKFQHAQKELNALAGQVDATARCLRSIGSLLQDPETKALHTSKLNEDTRAVSQGCNEVFIELQKAVNKFDYNGHKMPILARLQWPLDSNKLAEPLRVLKNYNDYYRSWKAGEQRMDNPPIIPQPRVLHAKQAPRTSKEVRALEESLQRLILANENLATSNRTLTDILYFQERGAKHSGSGIPRATDHVEERSLDGLDNVEPFVTHFALPSHQNGHSRLQKSPEFDPTHDHLQRCMDSVQELAKTIASAISVWQGHEKTGNTDIHGSHARLVAELGKLPVELECVQCYGRVPWADFDLARATSTCLGTCTCINQTSSSRWRPCHTTVSAKTPPPTLDRISASHKRPESSRRSRMLCNVDEGPARLVPDLNLDMYRDNERRRLSVSTTGDSSPQYRSREDLHRYIVRDDEDKGDNGASGASQMAVGGLAGAYRDPYRGLGFASEGSRERQEAPDVYRQPTLFASPLAPHDSATPQAIRPQPAHDISMDRDSDRIHDAEPGAHAPLQITEIDEDYRRRMEEMQRVTGQLAQNPHSDPEPDRERRRRGRETRQAEREERWEAVDFHEDNPKQMLQVVDNSRNERRENRVRIVDPPSDGEDKRPTGNLKRPTFEETYCPRYTHVVRGDVAPLEDTDPKGSPPGARWTKIDRRLVNPEALERANERFKERQDFVVVLRILTNDEVQKLADCTREIRTKARAPDYRERRASRRRNHDRERNDRSIYEDDLSRVEHARRRSDLAEGELVGAQPAEYSSTKASEPHDGHRHFLCRCEPRHFDHCYT